MPPRGIWWLHRASFSDSSAVPVEIAKKVGVWAASPEGPWDLVKKEMLAAQLALPSAPQPEDQSRTTQVAADVAVPAPPWALEMTGTISHPWEKVANGYYTSSSSWALGSFGPRSPFMF